MIGFQLVGVVVAALAIANVLRSIATGRLGRAVGSAWILVWTSAAAAILYPRLTVAAAQLLGIDRGADLVLYLSILAMIGGFFFIYVRIKRVEGEITRLVRHLALEGAEDEEER